MESFLITNRKGGVGKSTLATNLAGCFAREGRRVMLGDIERQQSSREWLRLRAPSLPHISTWEIEPDQPARPPKEASVPAESAEACILALRGMGYPHAKRIGRVLAQGEALQPIRLIV